MAQNKMRAMRASGLPKQRSPAIAQPLNRMFPCLLERPVVRRSFADVVCQRYSLTLRADSDQWFTASRREEAQGTDDAPYDLEISSIGRVFRSWLEDNFIGRELMFNGIAVSRRR